MLKIGAVLLCLVAVNALSIPKQEGKTDSVTTQNDLQKITKGPERDVKEETTAAFKEAYIGK